MPEEEIEILEVLAKLDGYSKYFGANDYCFFNCISGSNESKHCSGKSNIHVAHDLKLFLHLCDYHSEGQNYWKKYE